MTGHGIWSLTTVTLTNRGARRLDEYTAALARPARAGYGRFVRAAWRVRGRRARHQRPKGPPSDIERHRAPSFCRQFRLQEGCSGLQRAFAPASERTKPLHLLLKEV